MKGPPENEPDETPREPDSPPDRDELVERLEGILDREIRSGREALAQVRAARVLERMTREPTGGVPPMPEGWRGPPGDPFADLDPPMTREEAEGVVGPPPPQPPPPEMRPRRRPRGAQRPDGPVSVLVNGGRVVGFQLPSGEVVKAEPCCDDPYQCQRDECWGPPPRPWLWSNVP